MDRFKRYGYIIYFALLLISFLPYIFVNLCYIDELTLLAESKIVLLGGHQHRDFFDFCGGLNFYLVALVWRILGNTDFHVIKMLTFLIIWLSAILLTTITRRYTERFWLSLLPSLIYAGYLGHTFPFSNHHWFASGALILACYTYARYLDSPSVKEIYLCGLAAALSLLFIMHEGIVNLVMGAVLIVVTFWFIPKTERGSIPKLILSFAAGWATLMLPALAFYAYLGVVRQYIYNTFIWAFTNYSQPGNHNGNKLWAGDANLWTINDSPHFTQIVFLISSCAIMITLLIPLAAMVIGGGMFTTLRANLEPKERKKYLLLAVWLAFSGGNYLTGFAQPSIIKLIWASIPAYILSVIVLDWLTASLTEPILRRGYAALLAITIFVLTLVPCYRSLKIYRGNESELAGSEEIKFDDPLLQYIENESNSQDYFFGYKWPFKYYYLISARPATPYIFLTEKYLSRAQTKDLFDHLIKNRPKIMIFSNESELLWLAGEDERFSPFLNDNYQLMGHIGSWLVYQRKST